MRLRIQPAALALALALITISFACPGAVYSQQQQEQLVGPAGPVKPAYLMPRLDLSAGYNHVLANAPPGISNDFGLNRGTASATFHFKPWLGATAQYTGGHANDISSLGQNLTLMTYTAGPRVFYPRRRYVFFGQALFGGAHGSDSYFPTSTGYTTSANSFAYSYGGGVDVNVTRRIAIRALDAQFLHTAFANGSSNVQRHLVVGGGIVFKFGGKEPAPRPQPELAFATAPHGDIHFSCSLKTTKVVAGTMLDILGETMTEPNQLDVVYTWMPEAGMIEGTGREVKLNTAELAPGHYTVRGHAAVEGDYAMAADCEMPFEVTAPAVVATAVATPVAAASSEAMDTPMQKEFHVNVPDAYFDYNSASMRQDARAATTHAADFLNQHPDMRVRVEGFADERGSIEYNLILGQQRAQAARNALIAAGVDPGRVEIVSFGKADPVCSEARESCYGQNRRAAFSLHP